MVSVSEYTHINLKADGKSNNTNNLFFYMSSFNHHHHQSGKTSTQTALIGTEALVRYLSKKDVKLHRDLLVQESGLKIIISKGGWGYGVINVGLWWWWEGLLVVMWRVALLLLCCVVWSCAMMRSSKNISNVISTLSLPYYDVEGSTVLWFGECGVICLSFFHIMYVGRFCQLISNDILKHVQSQTISFIISYIFDIYCFILINNFIGE